MLKLESRNPCEAKAAALLHQVEREAQLVTSLGDVQWGGDDTLAHRLMAMSRWLKQAAPESARARHC